MKTTSSCAAAWHRNSNSSCKTHRGWLNRRTRICGGSTKRTRTVFRPGRRCRLLRSILAVNGARTRRRTRKQRLAELSDSPPTARPSDMGDHLLDPEMLDADAQAVSGQFGKEFARAVFALPPGAWHGPIESGYGLHLVRVSGAKPAQRRELGEVKAQVLDLWRDQERREENERYFASLLKKYVVVVDEELKPLVGPLDSSIAGPVGGSPEEGPR